MIRILLCSMLLVSMGIFVQAAANQVVHLKDYLGHRWADELISYPLDAELAKAGAVQVTDETGAVLPCQVANGRVYLLVNLPADGTRTFTITATDAPAAAERQVRVTEEAGRLTFDTGALAVRLPAGAKQFDAPVAAGEAPGPLQGVRGTAGNWIGKSWLQAPVKVTGYATTITARGPLFAEATVDYTFEGNKHYKFTLRAIAGQPTAIIDETMDLNPGGNYAISSYKNDEERSTWDWWWIDPVESMHPANAIFSFYDGLSPDQCRWRGHHATQPRKGVDANGKTFLSAETNEVEAYAPLTYEADEPFNRLSGWWINSFGDRTNYFTFFNDRDANSPVVSLTTGRPSRNVNPTLLKPAEVWIKQTTALNDLRIWTKTNKDLQVVAPICLGSREWLLSVEPQAALPPKGTTQMPYAFNAMFKYSYYPLEKIKDWVFDWPEPANAWPRLSCPAGDLAAMRARAVEQNDTAAPAIYRAGGTTEQMAQQALAALKTTVDQDLCGVGHGATNWFHGSLHIFSTMYIFEAAMAAPDMDPAVRAKLKAYAAFFAQRAWDDDYWPPKEDANGWGSVNMGTLAGRARVITACALAGHPSTAAWLPRCKGYLEGSLNPLIFEDGSNVSCPHYMGAGMEPMLHMALALKFGGGYDAFKENPRLRNCGQFLLDIITPIDPRSNHRGIWPLGHTSRTEGSSLPESLSEGYLGVDDGLAHALHAASAAMREHEKTPLTGDFRSRWYPSYGVIMRDNQPQETWLAARYSKVAFDHFQADTGAFTWYAKGAPLMMDFGSMYSPENGQSIYHNRPSWDVREGEQKPCPGNGKDGCYYKGLTYFEHKFEPWICKTETPGTGMGVIDHFGEGKAFSALAGADYFQGEVNVRALAPQAYYPDTPVALASDPTQKRPFEDLQQPFTWQRRFLQVKSADATDPVYLLVRDDFTGPCPPTTDCFWVMAKDLTFTDNQAHATGQFGVDLELYAVQPAQPQFSKWQWEHNNWGGEKQLCIRITEPNGKPVFALLYPHRPDEPTPAFTTLANGNGVKIQLDQTIDYAFLAPAGVTYTAKGISFQGTAGCLRTTATGGQLTLSQAGKATVNGVTLQAEKAASLTIAGKQLTVATNGDAQTLLLSGKLPGRMKVTLDGKAMKVAMKKGVLTIAVPAGEHRMVID